MAQRAFPGGGDNWGWKTAAIEAKYGAGMSTTKEISKIIRTAIKRWGGTIVFEGKAVYGASIFDPQGYSGDTDLEAQELFRSFSPGTGPRVPFGMGFVEFQWGGVPTIPTKAHFLTNWKYRDDGLVNTYLNQISANDLKPLFRRGHGLRDIWDNFWDFPQNMGILPEHRIGIIKALGELTSYCYGSGTKRKIK